MKPHPLVRAALWPAAAAFGVGVRLRAWLYRRGVLRQRRLKGIVISVGNLTLGGTGKTPMVIWLAQRLAGEARRVAVLTRGYRRLAPPATEAGAPAKGPAQVSDEVLVLESHLGEQVPIGVGADRYAEGCRLEQRGVEWFVLDDGLQHLRLARDAEIVLVDATNPLDGGRLLPAGRLREPESAMGRADVVVITRSPPRRAAPALEATIRRHTPAPIFYAWTELEGVFRIHPQPVAPAADGAHTGKLFAFCATGNPDAFFDDLRRWGMKVAGEAAFPDHHRYTQPNVNELERVARKAGAEAMVCTEKDIPNFRDVRFEAFPVYACRITLRPAEPEQFWQAVCVVIKRKRPEAM